MPTLVENKKAYFNYEILEKFDAGIELLGIEVKSLKNKRGSLEGSRVLSRGGEAYVLGMNIPPYQPGNTPKEYDATRNRRLLLTKKEIDVILGAESKKGLTVVPISLYTKGRKIKMSLGIARGKKKYDKRESIKKRDAERDVAREMRERM